MNSALYQTNAKSVVRKREVVPPFHAMTLKMKQTNRNSHLNEKTLLEWLFELKAIFLMTMQVLYSVAIQLCH